MGKIAHFLPVFARFVETAQKFNSTFVNIYRLQYWYPSAKIRAQRSTKQQTERSTKMKKTITTKVIEKLESDMIFCFECDEQEKAETYNQLLNLSVEEMLKYLED